METRAYNAPWKDCIEIYMRTRDKDGPKKFAQLKLSDMPPPGIAPPETTRLNASEAQVLMDDLWACGVRPTEGAGSAGAMAATQAHLRDLQCLLFKIEPEPRNP
jgi:hypothetical protein